jgi:cytochrome P450
MIAPPQLIGTLQERMGQADRDDFPSLLSIQHKAGFDPATISANVKLAISGGQNEPRDAIAGVIGTLLANPDQLDKITSGQATWMNAFEEYARWMSPIGMSPRRIAEPHTYAGFDVSARGSCVFHVFLGQSGRGSF